MDNELGTRLRFVREKLNMTLEDVSRATGIKTPTLSRTERVGSTSQFKALERVANYYNHNWEVFTHPPTFKGVPVVEISFTWLLLGHDPNKTLRDKIVKEFENDYRQKEMDYIERIFKLEMDIKKLEARNE